MHKGSSFSHLVTVQDYYPFPFPIWCQSLGSKILAGTSKSLRQNSANYSCQQKPMQGRLLAQQCTPQRRLAG